MPFLGIHLTPRFNQNAIVGPNALPYFFNEIDKKDIEDIKFIFYEEKIEIISTVKSDQKTGVEMEALTSVSVAALTDRRQFRRWQ